MSKIDFIRYVDEMTLDMRTCLQPHPRGDHDGTYRIAQWLSEFHIWIKARVDMFGCELLQKLSID